MKDSKFGAAASVAADFFTTNAQEQVPGTHSASLREGALAALAGRREPNPATHVAPHTLCGDTFKSDIANNDPMTQQAALDFVAMRLVLAVQSEMEVPTMRKRAIVVEFEQSPELSPVAAKQSHSGAVQISADWSAK